MKWTSAISSLLNISAFLQKEEEEMEAQLSKPLTLKECVTSGYDAMD